MSGMAVTAMGVKPSGIGQVLTSISQGSGYGTAFSAPASSSSAAYWSPYNWVISPFTTDIVVTAPYVASPSLGSVQTLFTQTYTVQKSGSTIQINVIINSGHASGSGQGCVFMLFNGSSVVDYMTEELGAVSTSAQVATACTTLTYALGSYNAGTVLTLTVAACVSANATAASFGQSTVYSTATGNPFSGLNASSISIFEMVANSNAVLWTKNMPVAAAKITTPYTSGTQDTTTMYAGYQIQKIATNSVLQITGSIAEQTIGAASFFSQFRAFTSVSYSTDAATGVTTLPTGYQLCGGVQSGVSLGTTTAAGNYTNCVSINIVSSPTIYVDQNTLQDIFAGFCYLIFGAEYNGSEFNVIGSPQGNITVSEIVQGANAGYLDVVTLPWGSTGNIIEVAPTAPWGSSLGSTGYPVLYTQYTARSSGSTITFSAQIFNHAATGNIQTGILIAVFLNTSTTPAKITNLTAPSSTSYNVEELALSLVVTANAVAGTTYSVNIYAWSSYTQSNGNCSLSYTAQWAEFLKGVVQPSAPPVLAVTAPTSGWSMDYIVGGNSSGSLTPVTSPQAVTTSSIVNLYPTTSVVASTAIAPALTATQWIAAFQPAFNSLYKTMFLKVNVRFYTASGTTTQQQGIGGGCCSYLIGVKNSTTTSPITLSATPVVLQSDYAIPSAVTTDQAPTITVQVQPSGSSPSSLFPTGSTVVLYANWSLSAALGGAINFLIEVEALE